MKSNQTGRTMVEMLAVLAIIAVLAITGIYSYTKAMIKHQVNEIINKANLAYIDTIAHDSLDDWTTLKITGIDNTPLQGKIYKDAGFVLVENISNDVCNQLLKEENTFSLMTNTNIAFTVCNTTNSMVFDFVNAGDFGIKCSNSECPLEDRGQYCSINTNTCIMQTNCPDGEWNFEIDACDTCESVNGDLAPIPSENGCISCAESTTDAKPIWDDENKICVNCLTDTDCEVDSYCTNTTCTNCPANSGTTPTNNGQIPDTSCYCDEGYILKDGLCISNCPANSATNGTGNLTSNPLCKCNIATPSWSGGVCKACDSGYEWNGSGCVKTIASSCSGGFVVTAHNGQQYCVSSTPASSFANASSWCTARGMNLMPLGTVCPVNSGYKGSCPNLTNLTNKTTSYGFWIVTSTPYNSTFKHAVLIGPSSNGVAPGFIEIDMGYTISIFALCQ